MPDLGLIGYPLEHSFSPGYFKEKFDKENLHDWTYRAFPLEKIDLFPALWEENPFLVGLNVTIPYKEKVIPFLDELDISASKIGAVNTIRKVEGQLVGYNTDIYGFKRSLQDLLLGTYPAKALVLGTGGASKAVVHVLENLKINPILVSRTPSEGEMGYGEITQGNIEEYPLIINTTPLGTYPHTEFAPKLPYEFITAEHFMYDLVYNPVKTLFLKKGELKGAQIINGLKMLHLQADKAWEIWNSPI